MSRVAVLERATPAVRVEPSRGSYPWWALVLCMGVLVAGAGAFAAQQTLWLDETTQLCGLQLGPGGITHWLAGTAHDFGYPVAPDRMPPLSYWAGQAWGMVFGTGELAMRWFGIVCVAAGVGVIFETGRRAFGTAAGLAGGLMVGLSASVIERAVEIRAYPLFFLTAAITYYFVTRWLLEGKRAWWWGMVVGIVLTMYTHFYGVVFGASLLSALLVIRWQRRLTVRPVIGAGAIMALGILSLIPFLTASVDVSRYGMHWAMSDKLLALGHLIWSFFGHQALVEVPFALEGACISFVILIIGAWIGRRRGSMVSAVLALTVAIGLVVAITATFFLTVFKPALFQYNLWMVPALTLVLASGVGGGEERPGKRWRRNWALAGAVIAIGMNGLGVVALTTHAEEVIHGPDPALATLVRELGPSQVTVLHDGGSEDAWCQVYYPLAYYFHGATRQFAYASEKGDFQLIEDAKVRLSALDAPTRYIIVVRSGGRTRMSVVDDRLHPYPDGPATRALLASSEWRPVRRWSYAAMMKMNVDVFERVEAKKEPHLVLP